MRKTFCALLLAGLLTGCDNNPVKPITTDVGLSVATLVKTSGLVDTGGNTCNPAVPPAPDVQAFWDALPPTNRQHPFVGFQLWRNTTDGCLESRLDTYRALVTFNTASVSKLKGLVTKAELVVFTRALPAGVGAHPACITMTGGAGTLARFGPGATLPPVNAPGNLVKLQPSEAFPTGNTVFTFPRPWVSGPIAGASSPTTTVASGTGGAAFTVDVTDQVNTALNGGHAGMSWMLTSGLEGPITTPAAAGVDCKTSYTYKMTLTHL